MRPPTAATVKEALNDYIKHSLDRYARVVKAQVESNYSITMSTKHCLLPWIVRHAAWIVCCYVIHSDGFTSFERRWGRNYERAICEFGETLLYLPPQHKKIPKADLQMQKCIWLEKVSETGENYVATRRTESKNSTETTTRLQPRPRVTSNQSFRHTLRPLPDSPMATSPTGRQHPPLPAPPRKHKRPQRTLQSGQWQRTTTTTTKN